MAHRYHGTLLMAHQARPPMLLVDPDARDDEAAPWSSVWATPCGRKSAAKPDGMTARSRWLELVGRARRAWEGGESATGRAGARDDDDRILAVAVSGPVCTEACQLQCAERDARSQAKQRRKPASPFSLSTGPGRARERQGRRRVEVLARKLSTSRGRMRQCGKRKREGGKREREGNGEGMTGLRRLVVEERELAGDELVLERRAVRELNLRAVVGDAAGGERGARAHVSRRAEQSRRRPEALRRA